MFGFFKNLMGDKPAPPSTPAPAKAAPASKAPDLNAPEGKSPGPKAPDPKTGEAKAPAAARGGVATPPAPAPAPPVPPVSAPPVYRAKSKMERVLLPLKQIVDRFPAPLAERVATAPAESAIVAMSVETILERLKGGKVEVSLGELRRIAPAQTFSPETDHDEEKVEIPLELVLERLEPSLLPEDLRAQAAAQAAAQPKKEAPRKEAAPAKNAPPAAGTLAASEELRELFSHLPKHPEVPPPAPPKAAPPKVAAPAPSVQAPTPLPKTAQAPAPSPAQLNLKPTTPAPTRLPVVDAPGVRQRPLPATMGREEAAPAAARLKNATPASQIAPDAVVALPLAEVSRGWPETIREEIVGAAEGTLINYPAPALAEALRGGKVLVPWKQLRGWLAPALAKPGDPLYQDALVELPLPVVAPRFMASAAPRKTAPRVVVDEAIPSPFASRAAAPPPAPAPKLARPPVVDAPAVALPTPRPVAEPKPVATPKPITPEKPEPKPEPTAAEPPTLSAETELTAEERMEALGLDGKLPAELIERACQINGVAGAVITLKEGLVVAAKVPPDLKAEALGAFLPQLFNRVEQSTQSMEIGELQSLQFTAGNRPWQIWKAGAVLFAALGRPNELLPGAQLKIIAAQLARQTGG